MYMTRVSINAAPDRPHHVHPLIKLHVIRLLCEIPKSIVHAGELEDLHVADGGQCPATEAAAASPPTIAAAAAATEATVTMFVQLIATWCQCTRS
jgi:hypothetical protein